MAQSHTFFEEYSKIKENQRHCFIPSKENYDKIFKYLMEQVVDESISKATLTNWRNR
jgi:hypothetical protein